MLLVVDAVANLAVPSDENTAAIMTTAIRMRISFMRSLVLIGCPPDDPDIYLNAREFAAMTGFHVQC